MEVVYSTSASFPGSFPGIIFTTPKHITHDVQWLFPAIASSHQSVCFGCIIEILEDRNTVIVQKRHVLSELLQLFVRSNKIWELVVSKLEILERVWDTLFSLVVDSGDRQCSQLACECCIMTLKGSTVHSLSVDSIVQHIMDRCKTFENASVVKLLKHFIQHHSKAVLQLFASKDTMFFTRVLLFIDTCQNNEQCIPSWDLMTSFLSKIAECEHTFQISSDVLERIVQSISSAVTKGGLDPEMLRCLFALVNVANSKEVIYEYETSDLISSSQSLVAFLKKMLMCSDAELQLLSIKCLTVITKPTAKDKFGDAEFHSLQHLCLEKGVAEYLLELLSTVNTAFLQALFKCLEAIASCKKFFTLGHLVYGFPAVLSAVSALHNNNNNSNNQVLCDGLCLVNVMLTMSLQYDSSVLVVHQASQISTLLSKSFNTIDEKERHLVVKCMLSYLQCVDNTPAEHTISLLNLIERIFVHIESRKFTKRQPDTQLEFFQKSYELVLLFCEKYTPKAALLSSATPTEQDSGRDTITKSNTDIDILYYLCDRYFVPQAVCKLSSSFKTKSKIDVAFQTVFCKILLIFLEMIPSRGRQLGAKLCSTSFILLVYEFKVYAHQSCLQLDEMYAKILCHLCASIECPYMKEVFARDSLLCHMTDFNTPINEWKLFFEKVNVTDKRNSCVVMLTLIACSHMAECPVLSVRQLHSSFEELCCNTTLLRSLSSLGKRYLLYICCQVDFEFPSSNTQHRNDLIKSLLSNVEMECDAKVMFYPSELYLIWLLKRAISIEFMMSYLIVFFTQNKEQNYKQEFCTNSTNNSNVLEETTCEKLQIMLQEHDSMFPFVKLCIDTIIQKVVKPREPLNEIFKCTQYFIPVLSTESVFTLKQHIARQFLLMERNNQENTLLLIKCLNSLLVSSLLDGKEIDDVDLKLLHRLLCFFNGDVETAFQLEALNFSYLLLTTSNIVQDAKPISLFISMPRILTTLERVLLFDKAIIDTAKKDFLLERFYSAVILTTSEMIDNVNSTRQPLPIKILARKDGLIEALSNSDLPIMQLALLVFWRKVFEDITKSSIVQFVDSNKIQSEVNYNDVRRVAIAIHGFSLHQDKIVQEAAAKCFKSMTNFVQERKTEFLMTPWHQSILCYAKSRLATMEIQLAALILFSTFLSLSDIWNDEMIELILKIIESVNKDTNFEIIVSIFAIAKICIQSLMKGMDYTALRRLKSAIKNLFKNLKICSQRYGFVYKRFTDIHGVIFLTCKCTVDLPSVTLCIEQVERKIEEIDDDQTDSGEETN